MGKRSSFERLPRDLYRTQPSCAPPLLGHLSPSTRYIEPCAGDGALIDLLAAAGHECVAAWDIEPGRADVARRDALEPLPADLEGDCFITNPPWRRDFLHPLIEHLSDRLPTWLLFDADWIHTVQAAALFPRLRRVVSIGRVRWIPGTKHTGKDNCAWHLFGRPGHLPPQLFGRL